MADGDDEAFYTLAAIREMLGVPRHVVLGFVKAGFITPSRGPRNVYRFGFRDVVLIRTAQTLRAASIPTRRIVRSLARLRRQLPATVPISGLRIVAIGDDVVVRDGGRPVAVESGQLVMDFTVAASGTVLSFPDVPTTVATTPDDVPFDDPDTAIRRYRTALATHPDDLDASRALGALLSDGGAHDDALAVYDAAIARAPDDAELRYNRAIVLEDLGRIDDAIDGYEACVARDPSFADAHWNAARLYEQKGGAQEALRHFSAFRRLQR